MPREATKTLAELVSEARANRLSVQAFEALASHGSKAPLAQVDWQMGRYLRGEIKLTELLGDLEAAENNGTALHELIHRLIQDAADVTKGFTSTYASNVNKSFCSSGDGRSDV